MVPKVIEAGVSVVENAVAAAARAVGTAETEEMEEMEVSMEVVHRLGIRLETAHSPSWY